MVVVDDLLATGGTMAAAIELLRAVGADVRGAACIIELGFKPHFSNSPDHISSTSKLRDYNVV